MKEALINLNAGNIEYLKQAEVSREENQHDVTETVAEIIRQVRGEGDKALREYTARFDGWETRSFLVPQADIESAAQKLNPSVRELIDFSISNVRTFAREQLSSMKSMETEILPGIHLGQRIIPVGRAGAYIPGGRYPLLSSPIMAIVPAKVAGVPDVVACTPPGSNGKVHPAVLYGLQAAGADAVYSLGGAQAIAAMAYGTESMPPVDIIVGPGNRWVAEAKRQVFGQVGIDMIAGPSEVLIIADNSADAEVVASDLLAQAEHDPWARALLITTSRELGYAVLESVESLLESLPTAGVASSSWKRNGVVAIVPDLDMAAQLSDQYAPEHLEVHISDPMPMLEKLHNYGSLFLGENAAVVFSDKNSGTNHILPTGCAARYTGGLWVGTFLKVVTYQWLKDKGVARVGPLAVRQSDVEGLAGHKLSAEIRLRKQQLKNMNK